MARVADWWRGGNGHVELIGWTESEDAYIDRRKIDMRNMVLSVTIIAAISAGCAGSDESSASQVPGAGTEANNVAVASPEPLAATAEDAGQATQTLPSTASPLPLIAAGGILSLGAAALLRRYRNVR
jgi:hypothetical protein